MEDPDRTRAGLALIGAGLLLVVGGAGMQILALAIGAAGGALLCRNVAAAPSPRATACPVVCLGETSKQLIKETRVPVPAKPRRPARTANLFMLFAPLEGRRHVEVTDRHAAVDYAQMLKDLSDTHFPKASKIVLVQDNLSTHKPASLYEAFPAAEARPPVERFEWHYARKQGGWLDLAKSELSLLSGQCLNRRIPDKPTLTDEVAAWETSRNWNHTKADWQFTTADARGKFKRLYPVM